MVRRGSACHNINLVRHDPRSGSWSTYPKVLRNERAYLMHIWSWSASAMRVSLFRKWYADQQLIV